MKKRQKKFLKICVMYLLMVIFAQTAGAEEPENARPYSVGFGLGYSFTGYRKETDSQINRYLNAFTFLLDGSIDRGDFLHGFNIGFYMGEAQVAREYRELHDHYRYVSFRGNIEYALDYSLWQLFGDDSFPGYLGGAFRIDGFYYYDTWVMDVPRLTALFSLSGHVTQKWIIDSKQSLSFAATVPVLTYAVRPPFAGVDERVQKFSANNQLMKILGTGRFASIHNYWAFFGSLKYNHQVIPLISVYGSLGFEIMYISIPRPRQDAALRLTAGMAFTF